MDGENDEAGILLEELQKSAAATQLVGRCVGISVVTVLNARALIEECVGFIEQEDGSGGSGRMQELREDVDGITCVLAHQCAEINPIELPMQTAGQ